MKNVGAAAMGADPLSFIPYPLSLSLSLIGFV